MSLGVIKEISYLAYGTVPLSEPLFGQNYNKICSLSKPFPRTQARLPFLVSRLKRALDLPTHNLDTPPSRKPTTSTQLSCSLYTWPSTTSGFVSHHPPQTHTGHCYFLHQPPPSRKLHIHAYIRIHTRAAWHHYLALGVDDPLPRPVRQSAPLL